MTLNERLQSKVLLNDSESLHLNSAKELEDVIAYRNSNDKIFIADISDMNIVFKYAFETPEAFKARVNAALPLADITDHINNSNGIFLDFHTEINGVKRHGVLPVRDIALNSIYERARANCFTISNTESAPDCQVMPLETKANFLNAAFKLYGGKAKILYRDKKITSVMSGQYYHISYESMNNGLLAFKSDFPNIEFKHANISQEFFTETYSLNSEEMKEDIALAMADAGMPVENVDVSISAYTADHGKVAATFYGKITMDDKAILFGAPESIKHAGRKSEDIIKAAAKKLYASFQENQEKVKELPKITINNPAGCFRLIAKEYHLPKKAACAIADGLEGKTNTTAYEIYYLLNELVANIEAEGCDPIRLMTLQDDVAKVLRIDWKKFDKEFLWSRNEAA